MTRLDLPYMGSNFFVLWALGAGMALLPGALAAESPAEALARLQKLSEANTSVIVKGRANSKGPASEVFGTSISYREKHGNVWKVREESEISNRMFIPLPNAPAGTRTVNRRSILVSDGKEAVMVTQTGEEQPVATKRAPLSGDETMPAMRKLLDVAHTDLLPGEEILGQPTTVLRFSLQQNDSATTHTMWVSNLTGVVLKGTILTNALASSFEAESVQVGTDIDDEFFKWEAPAKKEDSTAAPEAKP